jgi:malonyl-CoA O-methyltransferase
MESFERFAHTYGRYNEIQKRVIKRSLKELKNKIVDLGCGSEGLCKYKKFEFYLGIDKSEKMLKLNPCNVLKADFNEKECYEIIKKFDFEQIVSFSALQWAKDLKFVFNEIKNLRKSYYLAIFTSNTFKTLHNYLDIKSPIYSKKEILDKSEILNPRIEILNYELEFSSSKDLLNYIKYSGVSGNVTVSVAKLRKFLKEFPFNKLEFEIVVLKNQ